MKTCSICAHPQHTQIDKALVSGHPLRDVAGQFNVSRSALSRHSCHLPRLLAAAQEAEQVAAAGTVLEQIQALHQRAAGILDSAERAGKLAVALSAIRECRATLELLGRLSGELQTGKNASLPPAAHSESESAAIREKLLGKILGPPPVERMSDEELAREIERIASRALLPDGSLRTEGVYNRNGNTTAQ